MKRIFKLVFVLALAAVSQTTFSQPVRIKYRDRLGDSVELVNTAIKAPRVKLPPALKHELSGGFRLNTNGYAFFIDKGFLKRGDDVGAAIRDDFFHARFLQLSLGEIKHPKEIKAAPAIPGIPFQAGSYILGKINTVYELSLGFGNRHLIAGKPDPGTVSVHWIYMAGPSMALLKPYYIQSATLGDMKYSEEEQTAFLSQGQIIGKSPFGKGLDETKLVPGIALRTGLHFDFASRKKLVSGLEVGMGSSFYAKKIDQVVGQDSKQFFWSFYSSLQFGGRW